MIKHHDQGNLQKERFIWAYDSRMMKVHCHGEVAGMVAADQAKSSHIELQTKAREGREGERKGGERERW